MATLPLLLVLVLVLLILVRVAEMTVAGRVGWKVWEKLAAPPHPRWH